MEEDLHLVSRPAPITISERLYPMAEHGGVRMSLGTTSEHVAIDACLYAELNKGVGILDKFDR